MTAKTPAIQWLEDKFTDLWSAQGILDSKTPGTAVIRPMIQFRSALHTGQSMTIRQADYGDPQRWWL